jgi:outer membrane protein OmpA-like peptidoglycan-associated protein
LYYFELPKKAKPNYVTYVKGKVFDQKTYKKTSAVIELLDLETGKIILKTIADSVTGEFLVTLPAGKNYMYNVSKDGYLFHSENFSLKNHHNNEPYLLDIGLIPMIQEESQAWNVGQTVVLKNVFFETASYDLKSESYSELERLSKLLKDYPKLKIEISGHTDSIGTESYNQRLSTNRAKAVYAYLLTKGISSQKITYKGYGSTKPIESNKTEEGRAANRRTAFTILEGVGNTFISKNKTGEQIVGKFLEAVSKPMIGNALVPVDSTKKE